MRSSSCTGRGTIGLSLGDTGLGCALLGLSAEALWADRDAFGQMLETFVFQDPVMECSIVGA